MLQAVCPSVVAQFISKDDQKVATTVFFIFQNSPKIREIVWLFLQPKFVTETFQK